ncbi:hypothetical protein CC1G_04941 [Coprinopsis cinerea okayama7|uniref:Uncharacterized protein n=1 Tax=Coprinopsis cinerea (strain Okayama-7 / 130 / ATCC MYA-4618 / FGSC 9003) TaxID=240176 RepID=A8PFM4_COPC7|nr:hypothetical protein CC1G_04941 [Coprinopsis cinerea okayama7\|eukprot:XP_001841097.2 hypothetical protein CC1G_04941 [Coprinopsis cinerea okayama7\
MAPSRTRSPSRRCGESVGSIPRPHPMFPNGVRRSARLVNAVNESRRHRQLRAETLQKIYSQQTFMGPILHKMNFETLMSFAATSRLATAMVQGEIKARLQRRLEKFIHRKDFARFMEELERHEGAIVGSTAYSLFAYGIPWSDSFYRRHMVPYNEVQPRDLNVVVPGEQAVPFIKALEGFGYRVRGTDIPREPYFGWAMLMATMVHSESRAEITVTYSRSNVTAVVLSSTNTYQMNMITASRLYCWWPELAYRNEGFQVDNRNRRMMPWNQNPMVDVFVNNSHWLNPCGMKCLAISRVTANDHRIGVFHYKGTGWTDDVVIADRDLDPLLQDRALCLRVRAECRNFYCSGWRPFHKRVW